MTSNSDPAFASTDGESFTGPASIRLEDTETTLTASVSHMPDVGGMILADVQPQSDLEQKDIICHRSTGDGPLTADNHASELGAVATTVDILPDEIILEIFSYFSLSENINLLQKVCTRWKILAQDAKLWYNKEYVIGITVSEEEAIATFRSAPQLRTVILETVFRSAVFEALSKSCHELTTLDIHYGQLLHYSEAKNLVDGCKKIHTLRVSEVCLQYDAGFIDTVAELTQLRSLQLKQYHESDHRIPLRGLADRCPHLCELDLGWLHYEMQEVEHFISAKRHVLRRWCSNWTSVEDRCIVPLLVECADSLEHLQLHAYGIMTLESVETFSSLGQLHNLRGLIFDGLPKLNSNLIPVPFMKGRLSNLQLLGLWQIHNLGDEAMLAISKGCPKLRELSMIACDGHTDNAFRLFHLLKQLEILKISSCSCLRDNALRYISALPALHTLEFKKIKFQHLGQGVECILDMSGLRRLFFDTCLCVCQHVPFRRFPGRLKKLRELIAINCAGCEDILDEIRPQMPECHIEGSFSEEY